MQIISHDLDFAESFKGSRETISPYQIRNLTNFPIVVLSANEDQQQPSTHMLPHSKRRPSSMNQRKIYKVLPGEKIDYEVEYEHLTYLISNIA